MEPMFETDEDFEVRWTSRRMDRSQGPRKMGPVERPVKTDRRRAETRNRARTGKEFNRNVNG
jgi:hypothetical protein